jgi:hypothetical protein
VAHPPVILDKHLDEKALALLFSSAVRTAKKASPRSPYEGLQANDEDFFHVLQLAWEEYALIVTGDRAFLAKAQQFQDELPKRKKDRCLRGVIIVPKVRDEQVRLLRALIGGDIQVRLRGRPGGELVTLTEIADENLGVDLRGKAPYAIELCRCPYD